MPASTCPPTKKPSEKFMYVAVTPPSGPRMKIAMAPNNRWNFHEPIGGSHLKR